MMPFSPFLTKRPSSFHVRKPARSSRSASASDQQDIVQAVAMESPDSLEVRGQRFRHGPMQGGNELLGCRGL